ncbi:hypothetical protein AB0B31_08405 [Catellatospora citrea]|uniref:hypothetical protein n=1 Tax=Catellatospora citrea TaxID=53366 RepID=UPI0033C9FA91
MIAGVLGAADLTGPSPAAVATLIFVPEYSVQPVELLVLGGFGAALVLGLATIAGVVLTWVRASRVAARIVAAARVVSLLMTSLIFLVQGQELLPAWVFVIAAVVVILDIVSIILVLSRYGRAASPRARSRSAPDGREDQT